MKKYTTNTKVDSRKKIRVHGTEFFIAIPKDWTQPTPHRFNIGKVRFELRADGSAHAVDPIPDSWFVDLSSDVIESTVEDWEDLV